MKNLGYSFLLILAAFIWGSTFVAQVEGNDAGPFTFVCIRNLIATTGLFILVKILDFFGKSSRRPQSRAERFQLWKAGIACGIALFFAMNLQQAGIYLGTSAGKSGFLTTCYIIFVPIIGIILTVFVLIGYGIFDALIAAALMLTMYTVFRFGCLLQTESDETV